VHRVHLAREFRRHFGCSVSVYIRRRAVQRAAERMGTSRATLSDAAHEAGFADHSHMCHAFQCEIGCSPTEVRSLLPRTSSLTCVDVR
jgi:AraC family transcriptional regulator